MEYRTVFLQEMINGGILMPCISIAYQHTDKEVEITLEAARKAMKIYAEALNGNVDNYISGNIIKPVFRKYN